jgi:hypothetical protein
MSNDNDKDQEYQKNMGKRLRKIRKDQQEGHRMNGADFGTSELIYSENIIINGFHFSIPPSKDIYILSPSSISSISRTQPH